MNIISIDPSKKCTGLFIKVDGKEESISISHSYKTPQEEVLQNIYAFFTHILHESKFHMGLIEGYWLANPRGMLIEPEIVGVIKLCFAQAKVPLITVNISIWKSIVKININKRKKEKEYLEAIRVKYGKDFGIVDEADAFLIYEATRQIAKNTKRMSNASMKIREKIKKVYQQGEAK